MFCPLRKANLNGFCSFLFFHLLESFVYSRRHYSPVDEKYPSGKRRTKRVGWVRYCCAPVLGFAFLSGKQTRGSPTFVSSRRAFGLQASVGLWFWLYRLWSPHRARVTPRCTCPQLNGESLGFVPFDDPSRLGSGTPSASPCHDLSTRVDVNRSQEA